MKRLFNDTDERWTEEGIDLHAQLHKAIQPVIKDWVENGYSIRDIQLIAQGTVHDITLSELLDKRG